MAADEAAAEAAAVEQIDFVAAAGGDAAAAHVHPEDGVAVRTAATFVIDAVPVVREGAVAHFDARAGKDRQRTRAVRFVVFDAAATAHVVGAEIGDIADEEAVVEHGRAAGQHIDGRAGDLAAIVAEDGVFDQHGLGVESPMLDGDAAAAGAGVVVVEF